MTWLNLWYNNISNEGAIALATALKHPNCKVTTIYIDSEYKKLCEEAIKERQDNLKNLANQPNNNIKNQSLLTQQQNKR